MARRTYLLVRDVSTQAMHFPHDEAGLAAAVRTAESHCGAELYASLAGQPTTKVTCRRTEVWELDGKGRQLELLHVRQDGVRIEPRVRLGALAATRMQEPRRAILVL